MPVQVFIHKMSEHMESGEIVRWLVREGDPVDKYQPLLEVMTDKVVAELESPAAGVLKGIRPGVVEGAVVPVGLTIAFIAAPDEAVSVLPPLLSAGEQKGAEGPVSAPVTSMTQPVPVRATPVARRVAKELGVDLALVQGTGPGGSVREQDVRTFAARAAQPVQMPVDTPHVPAEPAGWLDLTPIQRVTGQRMLASVQTAPQFALTMRADMTNALWLREALMDKVVAETGTRLSITALLVKVVAAALKNHPRANSSFEGGRVKLHDQVHMGVAVGTDEGLVVPVIREADRKPLSQVVRELEDLRGKAGSMRFKAEDLSGGTFTLSNLGMYGVESFTAILNPPQSAILAVGQIIKTPMGLPDDTVALRPMISLTLTVDHRCLDGIHAARFLAELKERLERPYFLLQPGAG